MASKSARSGFAYLQACSAYVIMPIGKRKLVSMLAQN